ncbi:MAG: hypothetical protein R3E97_17845 [Candidatus Eisenbacteria bacterium]
MKTTELRGFTRDLLTTHGAEVTTDSPNLLRIDASAELADRLGRKSLALAFNQRGLQDDPNSELATVGNPVFDRVLDLAIERGRVGIRFVPPKKKAAVAKPGKPPKGLTLGDSWDSYAPIYYHVFKVQYSVEETPDSLEVVAVDGITLELESQTPDLVVLWETLDAEPADGRRVPTVLPLSDDVLRAALGGLERRLRRRIGRLKRDATEHLAREGESIGTYYQNLIEEARTSKRKLAGGLQAREEKIRLLQLDWKRRMEEAQEFWQPKVEIELSGLGIVFRPTREYELLRDERTVGSAHVTQSEGGFLIPPTLADGTV